MLHTSLVLWSMDEDANDSYMLYKQLMMVLCFCLPRCTIVGANSLFSNVSGFRSQP